jgi:hypothetical protein
MMAAKKRAVRHIHDLFHCESKLENDRIHVPLIRVPPPVTPDAVHPLCRLKPK